jgi:hypothetical protein
MPIEQYTALMSILPHVEAVLKGMGIKVPRPKYKNGDEAVDEEKDGDQAEEEGCQEDEDEDVQGGYEKKKNFEATSEEDND